MAIPAKKCRARALQRPHGGSDNTMLKTMKELHQVWHGLIQRGEGVRLNIQKQRTFWREPLIQAYVWPSPFEDGGGEAQEVWWRCCRWSRVGDTVAVQEKTWA